MELELDGLLIYLILMIVQSIWGGIRDYFMYLFRFFNRAVELGIYGLSLIFVFYINRLS